MLLSTGQLFSAHLDWVTTAGSIFALTTCFKSGNWKTSEPREQCWNRRTLDMWCDLDRGKIMHTLTHLHIHKFTHSHIYTLTPLHIYAFPHLRIQSLPHCAELRACKINILHQSFRFRYKHIPVQQDARRTTTCCAVATVADDVTGWAGITYKHMMTCRVRLLLPRPSMLNRPHDSNQDRKYSLSKLFSLMHEPCMFATEESSHNRLW